MCVIASSSMVLAAPSDGGLNWMLCKAECVSPLLAPAGLLGLKNAMLTATKGTAVLNTHFSEYAPWLGDISVRELGSLTAYETGQVTTYALQSIEARGRLFVSPGQDIYEGQVSCCTAGRVTHSVSLFITCHAQSICHKSPCTHSRVLRRVCR